MNNQLEKIRSAFARKGFREKAFISQRQFLTLLDDLKGRPFDEEVAMEIWEQAQVNVQNEATVNELCSIIEEAQNILTQKLMQAEEAIEDLEQQKRDIETNRLSLQQKDRELQRLESEIEELRRDRQQYQQDLLLVTEPFGIDLKYNRDIGRPTGLPKPIQSRRKTSSVQNIQLQHIFYVTLVMALIQVIVIYKKYDFLNYYVGPGNNGEIIRKIMKNRASWSQYMDSSYMFINFRWQQNQKGFRYQNSTDNKAFKQVLNHYEFHTELSNKENLLKNLTQFCEVNKLNVFNFIPVTFILNTSDGLYESNLGHFLKFFDLNLPEQMKKENRKLWVSVKRDIPVHFQTEKKKNFFFSKPLMYDVYVGREKNYLWLLKPTFMNRGRGIHVFSDLQQLQNLMNKYVTGNWLPDITKKESITTTAQKFKSTSFVVQKYLEKPMLTNGRKFDIRVWVLVVQQKVYWFKQGYMRTSSERYKTTRDSMQNSFVHLTNNAIQKHSKQYGKHQSGNQLSFKFLQQMLSKNNFSFTEVMKNMKRIVSYTMLSVKHKLNRINRKFCFEVFGYDFMLDQGSKTWLIEVNTNPCIQESSPLLEMLMPRMLNDAFKLTIDKYFPQKEECNAVYKVLDYEDDVSMWEMILDLKK